MLVQNPEAIFTFCLGPGPPPGPSNPPPPPAPRAPSFLYSPLRDPARTSVERIGVTFHTERWAEEEFTTMIQDDFIIVIFAVGFVFICLWAGTRALFLALMAVVAIALSFASALCFYLPNISFFSQFHTLSIFILLGVGADDIFVFAESWRLSKSAVASKKVKSENALEFIADRLSWTYKQAAGAVWTTSFTTAVCFLATSVSRIMPLSGFGIFAAIAVTMTWLICVTWLPACLVVWEVCVSPKRIQIEAAHNKSILTLLAPPPSSIPSL